MGHVISLDRVAAIAVMLAYLSLHGRRRSAATWFSARQTRPFDRVTGFKIGEGKT